MGAVSAVEIRTQGMPRPPELMLGVLRALTLPRLRSLSRNVADLAFEDATHTVSKVPQQEGGCAALGINAVRLEVKPWTGPTLHTHPARGPASAPHLPCHSPEK